MFGNWRRCAIALAAMAGLSSPACAQWAIGPGGDRTAAASDEDRFVYIVFADPVPGRESEFNDWYQNTHLGDLVQLDGWEGAQRFMLETSVSTRRAPNGMRRLGYAVAWDLEGADIGAVRGQVGPLIAGGKSRKSGAFDYSHRAGVSTTYRAEGPRRLRPDGTGSFRPPADDHVTPRPDQFMVLEMLDPAPGQSAEAFDEQIDRYIEETLAVPGWIAAQRYRFTKVPPRPGGPPFTQFPVEMIVWETEGTDAPTVANARAAAVAAKSVTEPAHDRDSEQTSWWRPISPFITVDDIFHPSR